MRDSLIGYLLGALDEDETALVENELEKNPQLRKQLQHAARGLDVLERSDDDDVYPPSDLARTTCRAVWTLASPSRLTPQEQAAANSSWSLIDMAIAASILFAACLLFFPAINSTRYHARVAGCQNNFRQLGQALIAYSDSHGGLFPFVPAHGNLSFAGVYAPKLRDLGFISEERFFWCPAAERTAAAVIPSLRDLRQASGQVLAVMQQHGGGSYAYPIGYVNEAGQLEGVRNQNGVHAPLMADAPGEMFYCRLTTDDVGHRNILFQCGNVRQVPNCITCWGEDQLYLNDRGRVAPGLHLNDTVVGSSGTAPLIANIR